MMEIPKTIDITLKSEVSTDFRCQVAANALDIDVKKKSIHHLKIENINIPDQWNIGLVYGNSGSGKTTSIIQLFGEDVFDINIDPELPILNQLPSDLTYDECASLLNGMGLNSVPCWIRPFKTLSNGQQARAEAVMLMTQNKEMVFIDEWTSVVDRTVAKAMSLCLHKYAKRNNKRVVILSCHQDIIEWLKPDWAIDCNVQKFMLPKSDDFFFKKREQLKFEVREIGRESWRYFSKYHYLSENLPAGKLHLYGLFHNGVQIGFNCFANYVPHKKNTIKIWHFNRTVIHPDYNGLGLGIKLVNTSAKLFSEKGFCKIMGKFASIPMYKSMVKNDQWTYLGNMRTMGRIIKRGKNSGNMKRTSGFREKGSNSFLFEYKQQRENNEENGK